MEIIRTKLPYLPLVWTRQWSATMIALILHASGVAGILFFDRDLFARLTPVVLWSNFVLLTWTHYRKNFNFFLFLFLSIFIGLFAEIIGVNTGLIFGDYRYGGIMGFRLAGVPLLMGINWFVLAYCAGTCMHQLFHSSSFGGNIRQYFSRSGTIFSIVHGALLTTFFDWIMEPVAVRLGYWEWMGNENIPRLNYAGWFAVSMLLLFLFQKLKFEKNNRFAIKLILIQLLFFLVLRIFL